MCVCVFGSPVLVVAPALPVAISIKKIQEVWAGSACFVSLEGHKEAIQWTHSIVKANFKRTGGMVEKCIKEL